MASTSPTPPVRWGSDGHQMASRAAAETLPADVPAFFRGAVDQLAYLGPEPDRWRSRLLREMDQAWSYDHYVDLENLPPTAMDAPDRWVYVRVLYQAGLERPRGRRRVPPLPHHRDVPAPRHRVASLARGGRPGPPGVDRGPHPQRRGHAGPLRGGRRQPPPHHHPLQRMGGGEAQPERVHLRAGFPRSLRVRLRPGPREVPGRAHGCRARPDRWPARRARRPGSTWWPPTPRWRR
ncbi:MAG: hypothetical protein MZV65_17170 [Chromatiales bacterium]|nr:hypothetical protein [Chromatiales bacterium]